MSKSPARDLMRSTDKHEWKRALELVPRAIAVLDRNRKDLLLLDTWYRQELRATIQQQRHLNKQDLYKITQRHSRMGMRVKVLVELNTENDIVKVTEEAFKLLDKEKPSVTEILVALRECTRLKGVGLQLATSILGAFCKEVPLMTKEIVNACCPKCKFGEDEFQKVHQLCSAKLEFLGQDDWSVADVQESYWAYCVVKESERKAKRRIEVLDASAKEYKKQKKLAK
jgi:hypothetical protein